jgi:hypothetical protein
MIIESNVVVLQVMQEPIEKDFDFDAHIASLIARRYTRAVMFIS